MAIKGNIKGGKRQPKCRIGRLGLRLLMFAGLITLSAPGPALANIITVTTNVEVSFRCTLRQAIRSHNDKTSYNSCAAGSGDDRIDFAGGADVFLNSPLPAISGNLKILGEEKITLHGAFFTVNNGAVLEMDGVSDVINRLDYFTNLSFFVNYGRLLIEGGTYTNNGGSTGTPDRGGVIDNEGGEVTLINSTFRNNRAGLSGGAIYNAGGTVTIRGADISGNQANDGGGIYNYLLHSTIKMIYDFARPHERNLIAGNHAFQNGGGIYNFGGQIQIDSNNFSISGNRASGSGGGIYSDGGGLHISSNPSTPVFDVAIASNQAGRLGGGIYDNNSQLGISGIEIKGNSSLANGGCLFVSKDNAMITQTYFHDNRAGGRGGAVYIPDKSTLSVTASTFARDHAISGGDGIYMPGAGQLTVVNSTFLEGLEGIDARTQIDFSTLVGAHLTGNGLFVMVRGSILQNVDCFQVDDDGSNLQFQSNSCPSSIPTGNPLLAHTLENYGGPTPTLALGRNSAAIEAIPLPDCIDEAGKPIETDQRGFFRGRHHACDIGAFEHGARRP